MEDNDDAVHNEMTVLTLHDGLGLVLKNGKCILRLLGVNHILQAHPTHV
jgi:hypothetical protein